MFACQPLKQMWVNEVLHALQRDADRLPQAMPNSDGCARCNISVSFGGEQTSSIASAMVAAEPMQTTLRVSHVDEAERLPRSTHAELTVLAFIQKHGIQWWHTRSRHARPQHSNIQKSM
jgi:hypothetical protein